MITTNKICLSFGSQIVFDEISFSLSEYQRIGLVGRNGSGKSTLLKVLAGMQQLDNGSFSMPKNKTLAYIPQEVVLSSERTILDETFRAFTKITTIMDEISTIEPMLKTADTATGLRYAELQELLVELRPEFAKTETIQILLGLGFTEEQFNQPVDNLSVGWKMRVVLAKQLLTKADFYLFDEPTNHLDIVAADWFIQFLQDAPFGFMIVCHERYVLDKLCSHILALEGGKGKLYSGGYTDYEEQYDHDLEQLKRAYTQQQKDIAQKKQTINRFRASASKAKMAQSMIKDLARIKLITLPPSIKDMSFTFPPVQRAGKVVLTVKDVAQTFGTKQIFKNASFEVERGQKVAVIAPNGVGKSTLFNLIIGKLPLQTGSVELGYNVQAAIFEQDQAKSLDGNASIMDNLLIQCNSSEQRIRTLLGSFLFSNDDVHKKVKVLSGGEKNRVGMTNVLLQNANLLLLDEPTNHLDIVSKQILLKALQSYPGTLLFVSHDHDFINQLATHVIELSANGTAMYHGNYDTYREFKKHVDQHVDHTDSTSSGSSTKSSNKEAFEANKQLKKFERAIERLEHEIERISAKFADLEYGTPAFDTNSKKLVELQKKLKDTTTQWEALH